MTVFGICEIVSGVAIERMSGKFGRSLFFAISFTFEITGLLFCLLWKPSYAPWVSYFLVVIFGISDGLRQPLIIGNI